MNAEGRHMPHDNRRPLDQVTGMEWLVIQGIGHDLADKEIAEALGMAVQTAKSHQLNIHRKLGVETRIGVLQAVGWLHVPGDREPSIAYLNAIGWAPV